MGIIKRITLAAFITALFYFAAVPLLADRVMSEMIFQPLGFLIMFGFFLNEITFFLQ